MKVPFFHHTITIKMSMDIRETKMFVIFLFLIAFPTHTISTTTNTFKTASSATLDSFLTSAIKQYEVRMDEIKNKVDVTLDPELQAAMKEVAKIVTVKKDGSGDFTTISAAIASIPNGNGRRFIIKIGPGTYKEKIKLERTKQFVIFYGDPSAMPTISFNARAADVGTWESATVAIEAHYFMACNVIFENTSPDPGMGAKGGQAVALRISGDKAAFYNCKFYGFQDTLCDDIGFHYYKGCYIRGTEDFIFGNARSYYEECTIESVSKEGMTAFTAQGRTEISDKSGFSFVRCKVIGTGHAYLSRAWRKSARVVFANTFMGDVVNKEGWDDWGKSGNSDNLFYGEFKCTGPGAAVDGRAKFGKVLTAEQAQPFLSLTFIRAKTWLLPPPTLA